MPINGVQLSFIKWLSEYKPSNSFSIVKPGVFRIGFHKFREAELLIALVAQKTHC